MAGGLPLLDRKRLELGRALATQPSLILLDEIAGGLTEKESEQVLRIVKKIWETGDHHRLDRTHPHDDVRRGRSIAGHCGRPVASVREPEGSHVLPGGAGMLSGRGGRGVSDGIALKIDTLDVHYKDFQALWGVSLVVPTGKIVSVIGANGSGKSTLLNTVAGHLQAQPGNGHLFGRPDRGASRIRDPGPGDFPGPRGEAGVRPAHRLREPADGVLSAQIQGPEG